MGSLACSAAARTDGSIWWRQRPTRERASTTLATSPRRSTSTHWRTASAYAAPLGRSTDSTTSLRPAVAWSSSSPATTALRASKGSGSSEVRTTLVTHAGPPPGRQAATSEGTVRAVGSAGSKGSAPMARTPEPPGPPSPPRSIDRSAPATRGAVASSRSPSGSSMVWEVPKAQTTRSVVWCSAPVLAATRCSDSRCPASRGSTSTRWARSEVMRAVRTASPSRAG